MVDCQITTSFLQLRLDVREPALVAGFGISGFWVGEAPTQIAAGNAASSACHTPSRRWKQGNHRDGHG